MGDFVPSVLILHLMGTHFWSLSPLYVTCQPGGFWLLGTPGGFFEVGQRFQEGLALVSLYSQKGVWDKGRPIPWTQHSLCSSGSFSIYFLHNASAIINHSKIQSWEGEAKCVWQKQGCLLRPLELSENVHFGDTQSLKSFRTSQAEKDSGCGRAHYLAGLRNPIFQLFFSNNADF